MERPPARIVARLDIKGPNVIKGVHLEGLRVVGRPTEFARRYYDDGIDEIIYMDVVASLYGRNNIFEIVRQAAKDIFVPLTVGGGLRSLDDIVVALRSGADKIAVNTAAIRDPEFIRRASKAFGSQCIVLSVEAKRRGPGQWEALTDNGREQTGVDVLEWVARAEQLGAGEVLVTSVDMEGTRKGLDLDLVRAVHDRVRIPVIACGGVGGAAHVRDALAADAADAVCCASLFHYAVETPASLKAKLAEAGIPVRPAVHA
jgi:cyclase